MSAARTLPLPRSARWLAGLGAACAVALFGLAQLEWGDPEGAVRATLAREADARARLVLAAWSERLVDAGWLADPVGAPLRWSESEPVLTRGAPTTTEELPRIELTPRAEVVHALFLIARDHASAGRLAEARRTNAQILAHAALRAHDRVEATLDALRWARRAHDDADARARFADLDALGWGVTVDGESARLTAALAAAPALPPEDRARVAASVSEAFLAGALVPAAARDTFRVDAHGPRLALDPTSNALRALLEERLPLDDRAWPRAFDEAARSTAALERALGRTLATLPSARWALFPPSALAGVPAEHLLAVRRDGSDVQVALHAEAALIATLAPPLDTSPAASSAAGSATLGATRGAARPARGPWSTAIGDDAGAQPIAAPAEALGGALPLPGTPWSVRVVHADPGALVAAEARRLAALRFGLMALGGALALATWVGVRAARRDARLAHLRSTFVASVSHDLRTPLASISSLAENLEDGVVGGPAALREYHVAIRREAARLTRLVSGLLDFARIERGDPPRLTRATVETAPWLASVERAAHDLCARGGVALRVRTGDLPATLCIDADALQRAALNLVENAVRHSGSPELELSVEVRAARLALTVGDRGRGVPASVREALFEPYACRGEAAGTGLGLAIVRAIAEAHGGAARLAEGADGVGLRATLEVACTDSEGAVA